MGVWSRSTCVLNAERLHSRLVHSYLYITLLLVVEFYLLLIFQQLLDILDTDTFVFLPWQKQISVKYLLVIIEKADRHSLNSYVSVYLPFL